MRYFLVDLAKPTFQDAKKEGASEMGSSWKLVNLLARLVINRLAFRVSLTGKMTEALRFCFVLVKAGILYLGR